MYTDHILPRYWVLTSKGTVEMKGIRPGYKWPLMMQSLIVMQIFKMASENFENCVDSGVTLQNSIRHRKITLLCVLPCVLENRAKFVICTKNNPNSIFRSNSFPRQASPKGLWGQLSNLEVKISCSIIPLKFK